MQRNETKWFWFGQRAAWTVFHTVFHIIPPSPFSWFWHVSRSLNTDQVCCRVTRPRWLRSRQYLDLKTCSARATSTFLVKSTRFWDILSPFLDFKTPSLIPKKQYEKLFPTFTPKISKTKSREFKPRWFGVNLHRPNTFPLSESIFEMLLDSCYGHFFWKTISYFCKTHNMKFDQFLHEIVMKLRFLSAVFQKKCP